MDKLLTIALLSFIIGCSSSSENVVAERSENNEPPSIEDDSLNTTKIAIDFFEAFDDRDLEKLDEILDVKTQIIHHNGVVTGKEEMIDIVKNAQNWVPRERTLRDFTFHSNASLAVVGFINEVTFLIPNRDQTFRYNETWILEKKGNEWYPLRAHYSLVTAEQHSEG